VSEYIWTIDQNIYLLIDNSVVEIFDGYKQRNDEPESGGCLFGYYRGDHIHVTNCTSPKDGDNQLPRRFDRKARFHLNYASTLYKQTDKTCTYLGDWHTHPQEVPAPSSLDFNEWDKIAKIKKKWKTLAIIVGRDRLWVGIGNEDNGIRLPIKKL
jgi:integrative and conjugative element protein (TIGR02256 family)